MTTLTPCERPAKPLTPDRRQRRRPLPPLVLRVAVALAVLLLALVVTGCGRSPNGAASDATGTVIVVLLVAAFGLILVFSALTALARFIVRVVAYLTNLLEAIARVGFIALTLGVLILAALAATAVA